MQQEFFFTSRAFQPRFLEVMLLFYDHHITCGVTHHTYKHIFHDFLKVTFKFPEFSRWAADPILYLAAVCCWKHRSPSHRRVLTPCGRSRRHGWCRSENGECGSTRRNRSWRTSLQDLSRMYAAEGWRCTGWNHLVPVAAAETSNKEITRI